MVPIQLYRSFSPFTVFTWFYRILLSNPNDPLSRVGGSMARSVSTNLALASLQKSMPLVNATDAYPSGVTLSFLESQITSSNILQSPTEIKHWLLTTVNHLLEKGKSLYRKY